MTAVEIAALPTTRFLFALLFSGPIFPDFIFRLAPLAPSTAPMDSAMSTEAVDTGDGGVSAAFTSIASVRELLEEAFVLFADIHKQLVVWE